MNVAVQPRRLESIDALRGLVMIIMALDHTRDFFHSSAMVFQPEDLTRTWPILFFTRWITHLCAPSFMLLAGVSAWFWQTRRNRTAGELSRHLLTRGLWLIALELVVMRFAFFFSLTAGPILLSVLWALGWSMIALAVLVHLPPRVVLWGSVAVILLHNLADPVRAASFGSWAWLWNVLHQPGFFQVKGLPVIATYPLIPWFAVMAAGYCLAPYVRNRRFLLRTGLVLTSAFLVIRAINIYGDPRPWSAALHPVLSFLNTNKYPPSLDYLLMTIGPALLLLAAFHNVRLSQQNPLIVFGRTPLFYFVVHFLLVHLLAFPVAQIWYGRSAFVWQTMPSLGGDAKLYPPDFGYPLWFVYLIWALVGALMYPLCRWYMNYGRRKESSQSKATATASAEGV